ncbi:MAG: class I SAM-dependent methyltransferase [Oligoflexales bacterium]|nr:class I SAM-dependent methyltransferase [Oligoflexales bacterium]
MLITNQEVEKYCHAHTQSEPELLLQLSRETLETTPIPQMLSGRLVGRLLKLIVQLSRSKKALEIGMFTGYSALSIAEGLPPDGKLITCDVDERSSAIARSYFARSPHGHKIEVIVQDALKTIEKNLAGKTFDFVFIDADKVNYRNYYEAVLPKVEKGGLILFDNALLSGKVLATSERDALVIASVNELVSRDERVENVLIPVRDGINLLRKK